MFRHPKEAESVEEEKKKSLIAAKAGKEVDQPREIVDFFKAELENVPQLKYIILTAPIVTEFNISQAIAIIEKETSKRVSIIPTDTITRDNPLHPLQSPHKAGLLKLLEDEGLLTVEKFEDAELQQARLSNTATRESNIKRGRIASFIYETHNILAQLKTWNVEGEVAATKSETRVQRELVQAEIEQHADLFLLLAEYQKDQPDSYAQLLKDHAKELENATEIERAKIILAELTTATQAVHWLRSKEQYAKQIIEAEALMDFHKQMSDRLLQGETDLTKLVQQSENIIQVLGLSRSLAAKMAAMDELKWYEEKLSIIIVGTQLTIRGTFSEIPPEILSSIRSVAAKERLAATLGASTFLLWNIISMISTRAPDWGSSILGATAMTVIGALIQGILKPEEALMSRVDGIVIEQKQPEHHPEPQAAPDDAHHEKKSDKKETEKKH